LLGFGILAVFGLLMLQLTVELGGIPFKVYVLELPQIVAFPEIDKLTGLDIEIGMAYCPNCKPAPHAVFIGLIRIELPSPFPKSDVTVTLLLPCIQLLPLDVTPFKTHPDGIKYS
jgi:hypothetical protein